MNSVSSGSGSYVVFKTSNLLRPDIPLFAMFRMLPVGRLAYLYRIPKATYESDYTNLGKVSKSDV